MLSPFFQAEKVLFSLVPGGSLCYNKKTKMNMIGDVTNGICN